MNRRKILALAGGVAMAALTATGALAQEVTLKLHQFLPAQANVPKLILDVWADNVEKDSGGRIKVERYAAMALGGKPPELIDQAIDGVADVVWTVVGYTPGRFPSTEVFELPFFVSDSRAASSAAWQMLDKNLKDTEFADVHILATWVHGPGVLHTKDPVNQLLERLGAEPIGMPVPAIPEALSKGVIDGTTVPWEVTTALKIPELVKNHTEFEGPALYNLTFVLAMNKDRYEGLPDDLKAVIDKNSGLEFSVFAGGIMVEADAPARKVAADLGNSILTLSGEDAKVWQDTAQPVYAAWVADMQSKGIDGQALIDEARGLMDAFK